MADKIKTLSAAIRYGSTFIKEVQTFVYRDKATGPFTCGCAIGTAYIAAINPDFRRYESPEQLYVPLSKRFGVPVEVLARVSRMHYNAEKTRAQCADWLEARGY